MFSKFLASMAAGAAATKTLLIVPAPQMAADSYKDLASRLTDDDVQAHIVDNMPSSYSYDYDCASNVKSALSKLG